MSPAATRYADEEGITSGRPRTIAAMQLSGVQAAAFIVGVLALTIVGVLTGLSTTRQTAESNRLVDVAANYAEAVANEVKSGGSMVNDTVTVSDPVYGSIAVTVANSGSTISVTATAGGISRVVQTEAQ
jgi:hypothetical protein